MLDSGLQSLVGFWIPWSVFRIPKPRIPDSKSKIFPDSGSHKWKFLGFPHPDFLTWGELTFNVCYTWFPPLSQVQSFSTPRRVELRLGTRQPRIQSSSHYPSYQSAEDDWEGGCERGLISRTELKGRSVFSWTRVLCDSVLCFVILFWVLWFCSRFCDSGFCFVIAFWVCYSLLGFVTLVSV